MWWQILLILIAIFSLFSIISALYRWETIKHYYDRVMQRNWDQLNFKRNVKFFFFGKPLDKLDSEVQPISIRTKLKRTYLKSWKDVDFNIKYMNEVGNTILVQNVKPKKTKELELFDKFYIPFIYLNVLNKQPFSYIIFYSEEETYKTISNFLKENDINIYKISHSVKKEKNDHWIEGNYYNLLKVVWIKYHNNESYVSELDYLIDQLMIMFEGTEKLSVFKEMIFSITEYLLKNSETLPEVNFARILKTWKRALKDKKGDFVKEVGLEWIFNIYDFSDNKNINEFDFYFKVFQDLNDFNYEFPAEEIDFDLFHTSPSVIFLKSDQWIFHPIKAMDNPQPMNIALAKQLISYKSSIKGDKMKTMVFIPTPAIYDKWIDFDEYISKSNVDEVNYFLKVSNISLFLMSFDKQLNRTINLMGQSEIFPHLYVFDNEYSNDKVVDQKVVDGYSVATSESGALSRIFFGVKWINKNIELNGDHLYKFKNSIFLHERLDYVSDWTHLVFGNEPPTEYIGHLLDVNGLHATNKSNWFKSEEIENEMDWQIIYSRDEKNELINRIFEFIKARGNLNGHKRNKLKVDLEQILFSDITYKRITDLLKQHKVSNKVIDALINELVSHYQDEEEEN